MSLVTLNIPAETMVLPLYVKMVGGVPDLTVVYPEDPLKPWEYSATLGSVESYRCELQTGFEDRLYCWLRIPSSLTGREAEFFLSLNSCEEPIFYQPGVIVPEPQSACTQDLGESACIAAGGKLKDKDTPQQLCVCP